MSLVLQLHLVMISKYLKFGDKNEDNADLAITIAQLFFKTDKLTTQS